MLMRVASAAPCLCLTRHTGDMSKSRGWILMHAPGEWRSGDFFFSENPTCIFTSILPRPLNPRTERNDGPVISSRFVLFFFALLATRANSQTSIRKAYACFKRVTRRKKKHLCIFRESLLWDERDTRAVIFRRKSKKKLWRHSLANRNPRNL